MSRPLPCYLRSHRIRAGLSQKQVARLLGHKRATGLSRFEQASRLPSLEAAFMLERIFDVPFAELFPEFGSQIDALICERVTMLLEETALTPVARAHLHTLRQRSQP